MIIDSNNNIHMIRGDYEPLYISLPDDTYFEEGDTVYFTVKRFTCQDNIDLQKVFNVTEETSVIGYYIETNDTKNLTANNYKYEVKVKQANKTYVTLIQGILYLGESINELQA